MLDAHIFECGVSASEGQSTFQNVSTALTLPINFRIDPRTKMGDRLSEQQAHPSLKVFHTSGENVVLLLTFIFLPPSKKGTWVAMFSNSAVFPGTQLHPHTRVNSQLSFYRQSLVLTDNFQ